MPVIRYIHRNDIDDGKWNQCMDAAGNGAIYGYTFYLDALCTWDAVVLDDYTAVMPLPWRKKWGIFYIYQPFAVAQLGVFGKALSPEILYGFLKNIPYKFRYWDFPLNAGNRFPALSFPLYERKNFVLPLQPTYEHIRTAYRQQTIRNLKKAAAQQCTVHKGIPVDAVIALAKTHKANSGTDADYERFKKLYQALAEKGNADTYSIQSAEGDVLASAVFFYAQQRAYYILPGNHPAGRSAGASHRLIDAFIRDHAGQNITLDFEGSDVPGLQFFYTSFGAVAEPYAAIRYNRLPWFLKWLKN